MGVVEQHINVNFKTFSYHKSFVGTREWSLNAL